MSALCGSSEPPHACVHTSTREEGSFCSGCLQKRGQLPKVSHWFCSSVGSLWADGCGFHNHVGAPGFGKTCLLSSEQCRASDFCWQPSSHVCCHSFSSPLGCTCFPSHLSFLWSPLPLPEGGSRGIKMTILSVVTNDLQICLSV